MGIQWDKVLITGDPLIFGSQIAIVLTMLGILVGVTYFKKWKWLWNEWFTTVDHKRIGIMYILMGILMFARGGIDGLINESSNIHTRIINFLIHSTITKYSLPMVLL